MLQNQSTFGHDDLELSLEFTVVSQLEPDGDEEIGFACLLEVLNGVYSGDLEPEVLIETHQLLQPRLEQALARVGGAPEPVWHVLEHLEETMELVECYIDDGDEDAAQEAILLLDSIQGVIDV